jgi:hypothetical protein
MAELPPANRARTAAAGFGPWPGCQIGNLYTCIVAYMGFQECPWGCTPKDVKYFAQWGSFDFFIFTLRTGDFISGPGLVIHLIREHGFFEGPESPYRVDPVKTSRLLELTDSVPASIVGGWNSHRF